MNICKQTLTVTCYNILVSSRHVRLHFLPPKNTDLNFVIKFHTIVTLPLFVSHSLFWSFLSPHLFLCVIFLRLAKTQYMGKGWVPRYSVPVCMSMQNAVHRCILQTWNTCNSKNKMPMYEMAWQMTHETMAKSKDENRMRE